MKIRAILGALILLVSGQVNAALISTSQSFNLEAEALGDNSGFNPGSEHIGDIHQTKTTDLSFNLFDPGFGVLQSVEILINGSIDWFAFYYNAAPYSLTIDTSVSGGFGYLSTDPPLYQYFGVGEYEVVSLTDSDGIGKSTLPRSLSILGGVSGPGGLFGLDIIPFIGTGSFTIEVESTVDLGPSFPTVLMPVDLAQFGSIESSFEGEITVNYEYEAAPDISPVPIPATLWLFGTGILGLIGFSKRRKAV